MDKMKRNEIEIQREYYARTASHYDEMHLRPKSGHFFALSFLIGVVDYLEVETLLDVGSGTGRAIAYIQQKKPDIRVVGIEPVKELREIGYQKGLSKSELIDGDATAMVFGDKEFDLVCEFGVLHHIKDSYTAVSEMLRVARRAIFVSDSNNWGHGSGARRTIRQMLKAVGLWRLVYLLRTGGRGYSITEGDGLSYSYSIFDDYKLIKRHCSSVHILNTSGDGRNSYRRASHGVLLGIKR
jgi:ubiquinone/menaquinone biosynthesis C-methylase UbiE